MFGWRRGALAVGTDVQEFPVKEMKATEVRSSISANGRASKISGIALLALKTAGKDSGVLSTPHLLYLVVVGAIERAQAEDLIHEARVAN